jgi:hypothetical protein
MTCIVMRCKMIGQCGGLYVVIEEGKGKKVSVQAERRRMGKEFDRSRCRSSSSRCCCWKLQVARIATCVKCMPALITREKDSGGLQRGGK